MDGLADHRPIYRLEPFIAPALSLHGFALLAVAGGAPAAWLLVAGAALLGITGLAGWRGIGPATFRGASLLLLAAALLFMTGGGASFFLLWLLVLVAVYPAVVGRKTSVAYVAAAAGTYLITGVTGSGSIPVLVILARTWLLLFVGGIVWLADAAAGRHAHARRDTADRLAASEQLFAAAFAEAPIGMAVATADGTLQRANQALCRLVGYSEEELIDRGWRWLIQPDGEGSDELPGVPVGDGGIEVERRIVHADGRVVWVRLSVTTALDRNGSPEYLVAQIQDVTDQRRAAQRIRSSEAKYRNLFERAPVAIWEEDFSGVEQWLDELRASGVTDLRAHLAADPDEVLHGMRAIDIRNANAAAALLLEADNREQLLGALPAETFSEETHRSLVQQFVAIWEGHDRLEIQTTGQTFTGRRIDVIIHWVVPHIDGRRDLSRVIVAVSDITQQKAAEMNLERLMRSKDEFVASVSHELRTPLTAVVGLAGELRSGLDTFSAEEVRELVSLVADQSNEVAGIVEDLLVAARAEVDAIHVVAVEVDIEEQLDGVLATWPADRKIVRRRSEEPAAAWADPVRVRQILRNMLSNALRYGGDLVSVRVDRAEDGDIVVQVADNGRGIPEEDQERIFDAYYRSGQMPSQPSSVGLGLTVSRKLAQLMSGRLSYRYEDGFSVFELHLPEFPRARQTDRLRIAKSA